MNNKRKVRVVCMRFCACFNVQSLEWCRLTQICLNSLLVGRFKYHIFMNTISNKFMHVNDSDKHWTLNVGVQRMSTYFHTASPLLLDKCGEFVHCFQPSICDILIDYADQQPHPTHNWPWQHYSRWLSFLLTDWYLCNSPPIATTHSKHSNHNQISIISSQNCRYEWIELLSNDIMV